MGRRKPAGQLTYPGTAYPRRSSPHEVDELYDCAIVGAGPAGLTAATYLARYRCKLKVFDTQASRAGLIPRSHNYPGFPDGIRGTELLQRLYEQARRYGVQVTHDEVVSIQVAAGGFAVRCAAGPSVTTRTVLLATGIVDVKPEMPNLHRAIHEGHVRLCPVCDGYEVLEKEVAVLGPAARAVREALFLRPYTDRLTVLLTDGEHALTDSQRRELTEAGIEIEARRVLDLFIDADEIAAEFEDASRRRLEVLYPALGCEVRSALAVALGARCDEQGYLLTDHHQLTDVAGLYAAGDVTNELNQICVATGHAAIAATDIYNKLRARAQRER
jgi:thioredoxin reductase (NADPH)